MNIETASPFPFTFNTDTCALLVIDMQRDFIEPGGFGESLGNNVSSLLEIIPVVSQLLNAFRARGMCVIHTRECHAPDLHDCPPSKLNRGRPSQRIGDPGPMGRILIDGEPSADIIPPLQPLPHETVISKPGKGAFYNTNLNDVLQHQAIEQLIVTGVTTEVCVQSTLREANDRGYDCLLATDATASYFSHFKQSTIDMIQSQGAIIGWTATVQEVITALPATQADKT